MKNDPDKIDDSVFFTLFMAIFCMIIGMLWHFSSIDDRLSRLEQAVEVRLP